MLVGKFIEKEQNMETFESHSNAYQTASTTEVVLNNGESNIAQPTASANISHQPF